ncbi:hypothetical protein [Clostridium sp. HBUAS56010]|uniref:hypothetical protein n=1 Tax=Clostridium sp. HBUAS56010 TaxID=2571127 RepID=UPI00117872A7|nr:hypothetical protein [Clostridium sp. HBUAS56010]
MQSFNLIPLLIIVFLLICTIFLVIIIKVKRSRLWFLIILVIIMAGTKIHNRIINSVFYDFKEDMCDIYPEIDNIKLHTSYGGRSGSINIYMAEEVNDEYVETIFFDTLNKINKEPMSSYLKGSSNRKNKSWVRLNIKFYGRKHGSFFSGPYQHSEWFTRENQEEQTWENNLTGEIYRYSDYMN